MRAIRLRHLYPLAALAALLFAAPAAAAVHVVAAGETLTSVAAADGLSVAQLAAANGLPTSAQLISGQTLVIPPQSGAAAPSDASATTAAASSDASATAAAASSAASATAGGPVSTDEGSYVVQPGDTLTAIAERAGTTIASLAAVNGIDPNGYLVAGTVLSLDGIAATSTAEPSTTGSTAGTGRPPYPTAETVSAGQVGSIAAAEGVPASLADAIGWQESGFNNNEVSATGAVGVMQIEPGTWAWIQNNLSGGALAPASAHDNVLGGVLLLHQLMADTGGDPALAAAGYYQGLASVRQSGMYASTRHYVNDVLALQNQFGGP